MLMRLQKLALLGQALSNADVLVSRFGGVLSFSGDFPAWVRHRGCAVGPDRHGSAGVGCPPAAVPGRWLAVACRHPPASHRAGSDRRALAGGSLYLCAADRAVLAACLGRIRLYQTVALPGCLSVLWCCHDGS